MSKTDKLAHKAARRNPGDTGGRTANLRETIRFLPIAVNLSAATSAFRAFQCFDLALNRARPPGACPDSVSGIFGFGSEPRRSGTDGIL